MLAVVHWHEKLASNLGLWCRFLEPVTGACARGLMSESVCFMSSIHVKT